MESSADIAEFKLSYILVSASFFLRGFLGLSCASIVSGKLITQKIASRKLQKRIRVVCQILAQIAIK